MGRSEHRAEAERLLREIESKGFPEPAWLARTATLAQVHATLALLPDEGEVQSWSAEGFESRQAANFPFDSAPRTPAPAPERPRTRFTATLVTETCVELAKMGEDDRCAVITTFECDDADDAAEFCATLERGQTMGES